MTLVTALAAAVIGLVAVNLGHEYCNDSSAMNRLMSRAGPYAEQARYDEALRALQGGRGVEHSCTLSDMYARGREVAKDADTATYYAAMCGQVRQSITAAKPGPFLCWATIDRSFRASVRSGNYLAQLERGLADYETYAQTNLKPQASAYYTQRRRIAVERNAALVAAMDRRKGNFWMFVGLGATLGACVGLVFELNKINTSR